MTATAETKSARIEFKTTQEIKALLQGAARTLGMDLSSFLISTATQRARDVMIEEKMLALSQQEWERFEHELAHPAPPTKELKGLMETKGFNG